jgi:hypothetical protein
LSSRSLCDVGHSLKGKIQRNRFEKVSLDYTAYDVLQEVFGDTGLPRLKGARHYFLPLNQDSIPLLKEAFVSWKEYDEYMLLKGEQFKTGKNLFLAVKCSKRGNDVFARRLDLKLGFLDTLKNVKFFDGVNFEKEPYAPANLLWITLTWDSKLCSLHDAWKTSYEELHRFKANLEAHYGKIEWLSFIQPFPDKKGAAYGYPHFHLLVLFKEASFNAFPHLEKHEGKTQLRYRIREKRELEMASRWHSFVDVQALSSLKGAVAYCKKYAKSVCYGDSDKAVLTEAFSWLYRKKSYTLTHGFQEALLEFIVSMQVRKNSTFGSVQTTLVDRGFPEWTWQFCGIRSRFAVGVDSPDVWVKELSIDEFERAVRGYG